MYGIPKPALDMSGKPHGTVDYIREGVAAGWRLVVFRDGREERLSTTEVQKRLGVDPFANVFPLIRGGE